MPGEEPTNAIERVLESDRSLQLLEHLHDQRLQASADCVTISVEELPSVIADLHTEDDPGVADGRAAVLSKMLREEWLPALDACTMVEYDRGKDTVTATPRTTLFYLVVQPDHLDQRDQEEVASACGWLAWREPFRLPASQDNEEDHDQGET
jgi:hypothetical protein